MDHMEHFYRELLDHLKEGVYFVDRKKSVTFWNKGAEQLTGYKREEIIGSHCCSQLLAHTDSDGRRLCRGHCPLSIALAKGNTHHAELYYHHRDGYRIPVITKSSPILDKQSNIIGAVQVFSDVTEKKRMAARITELERLALVDPVTSLPNRRLLQSALDARFSELRRFFIPFGVQLLDIDRFKEVNDQFGHDMGDAALRMVARTIEYAVRPFDTAGRWGGDEFLIILPHLNRNALRQIAARIRTMVEESFIQRNGQIIRVTTSIGSAMASQNDSIESLLQKADERLLEAKRLGRNLILP